MANPVPPGSSTLATLSALLRGPTDRHAERRILDLLAACPAADLDAIVKSGDTMALLSGLDDRLVGPDNYTALIRLLTQDRVNDLTIPARAVLASALQRGRTGSRDEQGILALFRATRGAELTAFKEALDGGLDHRDLVQMVFHDIDEPDVRAAILAHLTAEAAGVAEAGVKVLSDIDDTFYANWRDARYPKKTVYPGVRQLYAELSGTPLDPAAAVVTFITARPGDRLGVMEGGARASLRERGLPRARVLTGELSHVLTNEAIAEAKLANFKRYRAVFPELSFIFLGDSGQGDITVGEGMLAVASASVRLVLIHDVVATPPEQRAALGAAGIHLFDTYVGAAAVAFEAGLLSAEGVRRVAAAAERELSEVAFASADERDARLHDLSCDLDRMRRLLDG